MIEWWQAVVISLPSAILGGLVVGITALVVQGQQLSHDASMQAQRLDHDRSLKIDETLREAKRARLKPVFELLSDIDAMAARVLWAQAFDATMADPRVQDIFPGGLSPERERRLRESLATDAPSFVEDEFFVRTMGLLSRISDSQLKVDIWAAVVAVADRTQGDLGALAKMADIHARLEAEATRISQESNQPHDLH